MAEFVIGWDIGGAHVKAALVGGGTVRVAQEACPLWRGVAQLDIVIPRVLARLGVSADYRHAVTMTGELVDAFPDRFAGVEAIIAALGRLLGARIEVFAGPKGILAPDRLAKDEYEWVASANWLASACFLADALPAALFVDVGSTTADILPVEGGRVHNRGYRDHERMKHGELVYTGVARTPVMAVADRAPLDGDMIPLAAEHFATMADVYRLLGLLPEYADQWPAADGGEKTPAGSARRLARMLGCDSGQDGWQRFRVAAVYLAECQVQKLLLASLRQLSRGLLDDSAPLVGAGVGRFLVAELALRLGRPYMSLDGLMGVAVEGAEFGLADVAPAVAVANLARRQSA